MWLILTNGYYITCFEPVMTIYASLVEDKRTSDCDHTSNKICAIRHLSVENCSVYGKSRTGCSAALQNLEFFVGNLFYGIIVDCSIQTFNTIATLHFVSTDRLID